MNQESAREHRKLAEWISTLNFRQTQSKISEIRKEGTGTWVLEDDKFKGWIRGHTKNLWSPGIPGVGKTVLSSFIISYLIKEFYKCDKTAVCYFYCNYKEQRYENPNELIYNLIASLLRQLVEDHSSVFERVQKQYKPHQSQNYRPTTAEICGTISEEVKRLSRTFIIVDALDEITDDHTRSQLLERLQSLGGSLLVTSRDISAIREGLGNCQRMDICANLDDMRCYMEGRMTSSSRLGRVIARDPILRDEIIQAIIQRANGMFLLCSLLIGALESQLTPRAVRDTLKKLPEGLNSAYSDTLERIWQLQEKDRRVREIALTALMLIVNAFRPLTLSELQHAIAFSIGIPQTGNDDLIDETIIVDACAGLVRVDHINVKQGVAQTAVRLVHYTAQEYLAKNTKWLHPQPGREITRICIYHITHEATFTDYALKYWADHARGLVEETDRPMLFDFFRNQQALDVALEFANTPYSSAGYHFGGLSMLHICACFGLLQMLRDSIEVVSTNTLGEAPTEAGRVDINMRDELGRTPLFWAARVGHIEVVEYLLSRGDVDANAGDVNGWTPIAIATMRGHTDIIKLLLERQDVDINARDSECQTPLAIAVKWSRTDIIKMMLERQDVDVNTRDIECQTPLARAAMRGRTEIVELLLERQDVDVNVRDTRAWTPLARATMRGRTDIVKLLLERQDVDVNTRDVKCCTPLAIAVAWGEIEIVKLLLNSERQDVDVNTRDLEGRTPLAIAATRGHTEIVKLLLERQDVDINTKDVEGWTPIRRAAFGGYTELVELFLDSDSVTVDHSMDWPQQIQRNNRK